MWLAMTRAIARFGLQRRRRRRRSRRSRSRSRHQTAAADARQPCPRPTPQLDHIGSAATQDKAEQQQLQTLLVLDLQRPAAAAAALTVGAHGSSGHAAPAAGSVPLEDAVLRVAFGGGPHLLLAACTRDTLAVVSLEGLAAHLFHQQTSGACSAAAAHQPLWQQLAAVHCGHAEVLAIRCATGAHAGRCCWACAGPQPGTCRCPAGPCRPWPADLPAPCPAPRSWTQQLDGILASSADGTLTMWQLRPLATPSVPEQAPLPPPGSASGPPGATLRAAWSVHAPIPQRLVCAGVNVYAPSATAAGHSGGSAISPSKDAPGAASAAASPARDGVEGERYASVWWPQHREQRQRHYAGGMPAVGQEKLRHTSAVTGGCWMLCGVTGCRVAQRGGTAACCSGWRALSASAVLPLQLVCAGLQWSPGVLQKDALSIAAAGSGGGGAGGASPGGTGAASDPASPSGAAAAATTDAEDHPALMTTSEGAGAWSCTLWPVPARNQGAPCALLGHVPASLPRRRPVLSPRPAVDGAVRVWVETLVLTESSALPCLPGQPSPDARSQQTPPKPPPQLRRRSPSPGGGSPGAAPSSPRDVRAAAAAAAALGAAAPAITSYFCMALLIDPAATAAGAAAAAAAAVAGAAAGGGTADSTRTPRGLPLPQVALWARHAGALLLHKQQRRVAAPVLWLFTATVEHKVGDSTCRLLLHLHAVRGLAAIIMSAGYGGSLSSTSGGSSSTRPAAVLWGRHAWELPAAAAGTSPAALLQQLCCWVSDEEGYPLLHTFTSGGGAGRPLLAGRTFSTVQEEGPLSHMQVRVWAGGHRRVGGGRCAMAVGSQVAAAASRRPVVALPCI